MRWITALLVLLAALSIPAIGEKVDEQTATQNDVVIAARSVVRVAFIGNDSKLGEYLLGHGSGVAVAPGLIVTNAHVVAPCANRPTSRSASFLRRAKSVIRAVFSHRTRALISR